MPMTAFFFRRAPGVRWTPVRQERHATQMADDALEATPGASHGSCGLVLPDSFALRLGARRHVTPRNPVHCPLEDTALRQWCVRLQNGACPNETADETPDETPVFLKLPG
jgi:hypothetical protein